MITCENDKSLRLFIRALDRLLYFKDCLALGYLVSSCTECNALRTHSHSKATSMLHTRQNDVVLDYYWPIAWACATDCVTVIHTRKRLVLQNISSIDL